MPENPKTLTEEEVHQLVHPPDYRKKVRRSKLIATVLLPLGLTGAGIGGYFSTTTAGSENSSSNAIDVDGIVGLASFGSLLLGIGGVLDVTTYKRKQKNLMALTSPTSIAKFSPSSLNNPRICVIDFGTFIKKQRNLMALTSPESIANLFPSSLFNPKIQEIPVYNGPTNTASDMKG